VEWEARFERRARFVIGAIVGGIIGLLNAPNWQGQLSILGIDKYSLPPGLAIIVASSLVGGYLCSKLPSVLR